MISVDQILTIKLTSGEELVAKVVSVDPDSIQVTGPVSVAPGPQGMGLVPSMFTADPALNVRINTNSVAMYVETDDNVRMKYIEATTGIKVPEKKIIMG